MQKQARAATAPAIPAPKITTSVGDTPGNPPNRIPLPPLSLVSNSAAINIAADPSISQSELTTGKLSLLSAINS